MKRSHYILITTARNEEDYIEKTIQSVISQTILPIKWVIVSDGSTDKTDEIVNKYVKENSFIELLHLSNNREWSFENKVKAFKAGYEKIKNLEYDFIGNLDADVTFRSDYFEKVLEKFKENERLGICGGMVVEHYNGKIKILKYNLNSVAGAVQLFRKQCFMAINGYIPMKYGGVDAIAEVMARMHGWQVKSFPDIIVYHNRRIGLTKNSLISSRLLFGKRDYLIGTHPLFMFLKTIYRFNEKPYIIGGILIMFGYLCAYIKRESRTVPVDVIEYIQKEQCQRMKSVIFRLLNRD